LFNIIFFKEKRNILCNFESLDNFYGSFSFFLYFFILREFLGLSIAETNHLFPFQLLDDIAGRDIKKSHPFKIASMFACDKHTPHY